MEKRRNCSQDRPNEKKKKSENVIYFCLLHHMLHLYPRRILVVNVCRAAKYSRQQHTHIDISIIYTFQILSKRIVDESWFGFVVFISSF